ncbi:zinc finger protein ZFPM1 [Orycteropus afer afer]|uniref:Zinc finger protein ZFPM1 n=1 Tax=Orycteropus afer afer TaxID=1230840 RepID=A0A8B6ZTZ6_ORYAF|nr:zinc finger protein ZFPM1 [Orycteropus afer afer]
MAGACREAVGSPPDPGSQRPVAVSSTSLACVLEPSQLPSLDLSSLFYEVGVAQAFLLMLPLPLPSESFPCSPIRLQGCTSLLPTLSHLPVYWDHQLSLTFPIRRGDAKTTSLGSGRSGSKTLSPEPGSLGDMEAGEEVQAVDAGLSESEATAPKPAGEPEPLSPAGGAPPETENFRSPLGLPQAQGLLPCTPPSGRGGLPSRQEGEGSGLVDFDPGAQASYHRIWERGSAGVGRAKRELEKQPGLYLAQAAAAPYAPKRPRGNGGAGAGDAARRGVMQYLERASSTQERRVVAQLQTRLGLHEGLSVPRQQSGAQAACPSEISSPAARCPEKVPVQGSGPGASPGSVPASYAALLSPRSLSTDELELVLREDGRRCVRARHGLAEGCSWGPFRGSVQSEASSPRQVQPSPPLTLQLEDEGCWLRTLPQAATEVEANSLIYRKDEQLWCRITKPVPAGGLLSACLTAELHSVPSPPRKRELAEAEGQAPPYTDIQLLPQQAGMASILATAVINKDIFPCKDCGIWYRSERNLQAHLLYYCASRQSAGSPAAAAEDKPKDTYPNERVCPFPQCRKSCPSASSLEIHLRSHSGERPFVCLICLSAFTTKANCERHLKVHTDTLNGVCHSCGFISTTRDILYSHLVTSHMICQPGSKGELYSPGAGFPAAKPPADSLASGFPQHAALQGALAAAEMERKPLAEATNGEAWAAPQNGGGPLAVPGSIKVEVVQEPEAAQTASPAPRAPSRTPSPRSPQAVRVKAERSSPSPACSPAPGELGTPAGPLFLPQFVFGADAVPQASEILAKMSELVHNRLKQGQGAPGLFAGASAPKGATCFQCEITFNNINNYYVHKRLYCSGRHLAEDAPGPDAVPPPLPAHSDKGVQTPGKGPPAPVPNGNPRYCRLCNIRFSSLSTFIAHKKYYCSSHAAEHVK